MIFFNIMCACLMVPSNDTQHLQHNGMYSIQNWWSIPLKVSKWSPSHCPSPAPGFPSGMATRPFPAPASKAADCVCRIASEELRWKWRTGWVSNGCARTIFDRKMRTGTLSLVKKRWTRKDLAFFSLQFEPRAPKTSSKGVCTGKHTLTYTETIQSEIQTAPPNDAPLDPYQQAIVWRQWNRPQATIISVRGASRRRLRLTLRACDVPRGSARSPPAAKKAGGVKNLTGGALSLLTPGGLLQNPRRVVTLHRRKIIASDRTQTH